MPRLSLFLSRNANRAGDELKGVPDRWHQRRDAVLKSALRGQIRPRLQAALPPAISLFHGAFADGGSGYHDEPCGFR